MTGRGGHPVESRRVPRKSGIGEAIQYALNHWQALVRKRKDETLHQLLVRLDAAIGKAWDEGDFADEINSPR